MGNETSSVKIHSLLTADDIKRLRAGFPVSIASKSYFTVSIEMAGGRTNQIVEFYQTVHWFYFQDEGAGVQPPPNLQWGPWKTAWNPRPGSRVAAVLYFFHSCFS